jgi:hypothetical protein
MLVFCLFTLGLHGNFAAGVTRDFLDSEFDVVTLYEIYFLEQKVEDFTFL